AELGLGCLRRLREGRPPGNQQARGPKSFKSGNAQMSTSNPEHGDSPPCEKIQARGIFPFGLHRFARERMRKAYGPRDSEGCYVTYSRHIRHLRGGICVHLPARILAMALAANART